MDRRIVFWAITFVVPYILSFLLKSPVSYEQSDSLFRLMLNAQIGLVPICAFGGGLLATLLNIKVDAANPMECSIKVSSVFALVISMTFLSVAIAIDFFVPQWTLTTSSCLFFVIGWATEKMWYKKQNES